MELECTLLKKDGKVCGKKYATKQQLHDHQMANHWKQLRPKRPWR